MKVAELLRKLADVIAAAESEPDTGELTQPNRAELYPTKVDNADHSDDNIFVPPLQAKLEILKKSVGMDNVYDDNCDDEIAVIKKNAGLSATQQEAADDEPLDI